jgi:hypothetical protein
MPGRIVAVIAFAATRQGRGKEVDATTRQGRGKEVDATTRQGRGKEVAAKAITTRRGHPRRGASPGMGWGVG